MTVVTRFAPSPTGFLHIGGARTALFNYLYAKHYGGKFLLRVEDTDEARSTDEATQAIIDGMNWLDLHYDDAVIYQSKGAARHKEIADQLVASGQAYYCYCSVDELADQRAQAEANGQRFVYNRLWRDKTEPPVEGGKPVIRIKAPLEGQTTISDKVQGDVTAPNSDLDDFIILRADGSPTYMLAVVVDDHDMGVTDIIRGGDHLTNSFRQKVIYDALGWNIPNFIHVPLIHGTDGAKLSKRHGALGVQSYRDMGYLPEAICNYLLRLGWSHGDDEFIGREQAIEWFDADGLGKAAARIDFDKMAHVNAHYMKQAGNQRLFDLMSVYVSDISKEGKQRILKGLDGLKDRAKTIEMLAEGAKIYLGRVPYTPKALEAVEGNKELIGRVAEVLSAIEIWEHDAIKVAIASFCKTEELKMGKVLQPLRAAVCGTMEAPGMFDVLDILGKDEVLSRVRGL